jgi:hypothetical protein
MGYSEAVSIREIDGLTYTAIILVHQRILIENIMNYDVQWVAISAALILMALIAAVKFSKDLLKILNHFLVSALFSFVIYRL